MIQTLNYYYISWCKNIEWATPYKIYTPPVEDFGKVQNRGGVYFYMHLPSVLFLDKIYHRGSKYFI